MGSVSRYVGRRIALVRKRLGLRQEDLSSRLEITRGGVSMIELGRIGLTVDRIWGVAEALGVDPYELLPPSGESLASLEGKKCPEARADKVLDDFFGSEK